MHSLKMLLFLGVFSMSLLSCGGGGSTGSGGSGNTTTSTTILDQSVAMKVTASTSDNSTSGDVLKATITEGNMVVDAGSAELAGVSRPDVPVTLTAAGPPSATTESQSWSGQASYKMGGNSYLEIYTVTTNTSGVVTDIDIAIAKDGGNKVSLETTARQLPVVNGTLAGQYTITNAATNKKVILVIDTKHNLYADVDGDLTTVDDVVQTALYPDSANQFSASITGGFSNNADGSNSFTIGPVTYEFIISTAANAITSVTFNCYVGGKSVNTVPAPISFVDSSPVLNTSTPPDLRIAFGANSADFSTHWMNIPNTASWSEIISGSSKGTWNNAGQPFPVGYTGTETSVTGTRIVTLETTTFSGINCVKWAEQELVKTDIYGPYNGTPQDPPSSWYARTRIDYLAKATNGAIYSIAWGEMDKISNVQIAAFDPSLISVFDNSRVPMRAYQALPPSTNSAAPTKTGYRKGTWSFVDNQQRTNTQVVTDSLSALSGQTNGVETGLIVFLKTRNILRDVSGAGYVSHFESTSFEHRYWKPGTGFVSADMAMTGSGTEDYFMPTGAPVNGVINTSETRSETKQ